MAKFLDLDDAVPTPSAIGSGLKKKPRGERPAVDSEAAARVGQAHGFTRTTGVETATHRRRGRPPLNQEMTYWRIYISPTLRDELNALRDTEGRRLNDLLEDMLRAYVAGHGRE